MERRDALPLLLITVLYAFSAFFRLGSLSAPQSALDLGDNGSVELELSEQVYLTKLMYFSNLGTGSYNLEVSADGGDLVHPLGQEGRGGGCDGLLLGRRRGLFPQLRPAPEV
ncbi:MAG: hypothetical protein ACLSAF_12295 [Intestinimonas sp.]